MMSLPKKNEELGNLREEVARLRADAVKARALLAEHKSKQVCRADNAPAGGAAEDGAENAGDADRQMRTHAHETRKNQGD